MLEDGRIQIFERSPRYSSYSLGGDIRGCADTYIVDLAKKYLEDPTFLTSKQGIFNRVAKFSEHVLRFFGAYTQENSENLTVQMKYAAKELAEQIKSGKGADIESLQTRLSVEDVTFSVSDLMKTIHAVKNISDPMKAYAGESLSLEEYAAIGISESQLKRFGEQALDVMQQRLLQNAYQKRTNQVIYLADAYDLSPKAQSMRSAFLSSYIKQMRIKRIPLPFYTAKAKEPPRKLFISFFQA